jgi:tetratricopeptide (TPR) repeat protein
MKKLLIGGCCVILLFLLALNTGLMGDQVEQWVKANPKDPHAPKVLFYAARYCDILGDNPRAQKLYQEIYEQYPENSSLCAEALFDEAANKVSTSAATKAYAVPLLDTIQNQYPNEEEWVKKAKALKDEVTYVR